MDKSIFVYIVLILLVSGQHQPVCAGDFQSKGEKTYMSDYKGPQDTPKKWGSEIEKLRQPYIEEAKKTYLSAKDRFQIGLPAGYSFFVTVDFQDNDIHENAFMAVRKISDGKITAVLSTKLIKVKSHRYGEELTFPESKVLDWTITSPDGKEEGNFIGKFLDKYYKTH